MEPDFKPLGAVLIIPGVVLKDGVPVQDRLQIQVQGCCTPMEETREGIAQILTFLQRAAEHYTGRMVSAPSAAEREAAAKRIEIIGTGSVRHELRSQIPV